MSFLHRYLAENPMVETLSDPICKSDCDESNEYLGVCEATCLKVCPNICRVVLVDPSPPVAYHDHKSSKKMSIVTASAIVSALLLVCFIIFFFKSRSRSRWRSRSRISRLREGSNGEARGEFLDEGHGPIIDHPIWYIRTVGLQPSVISSIAVVKYKKGEGLVEGADCSVCLSEFEEDETLRLLPKCSHAFHVPCIDTWLRSHVNCPLCRAPIIVNVATSSSGANNIPNPGEIRVGIPEENRGTNEESEGNEQESEEQHGQDDAGNLSTNIEAKEDETQLVRRSVSLDSLSALRISHAVVYASNGKESNPRGRGKAEKMKRSVSCSGKFLLPRYV